MFANNFTEMLARQGRYKEADKIHLESFDFEKRGHGSKYWGTVIDMRTAACVLQRQGKNEEAESLFREAMKRLFHLFGAENQLRQLCITNLLNLLTENGKDEEWRELYVTYQDLYWPTARI